MKRIASLFLLAVVMVSFSHCSSAQKLQKEVPINFGSVYYQHWVAGIQGGGAGINLFIPIEGNLKENIVLDSVYFRGKVVKLVSKPSNPSLYIGRFVSKVNQKKDIIMSNKPHAEYGNEVPEIPTKTSFDLKENECVIAYVEGSKTKYFKIGNIVEKKPLYYPSAPNKKQ